MSKSTIEFPILIYSVGLLSLLMVVLFFVQLFVTNLVNREGVSQVSELDGEIGQYREEVKRLELSIATYSALGRIKQRAKELGYEKRDALEYIR